jgi:hypothetical protein
MRSAATKTLMEPHRLDYAQQQRAVASSKGRSQRPNPSGPLQSRHVRDTCTAVHSVEPRGVGTRRSVSTLAMLLNEVMPLDCRSRMMWVRSAARSLAREPLAHLGQPSVRRVRAGPPCHRQRDTPPLGRSEGRLGAVEIARRSSSATIAMMPTVMHKDREQARILLHVSRNSITFEVRTPCASRNQPNLRFSAEALPLRPVTTS